MFNPHARVTVVPVTPTQACHVVDDALLDPDRMVEFAAAHAHAFVEAPHNAFPGPELPMPDAATTRLDAFLAAHVHAPSGIRRALRGTSRLAMVARAPQELAPLQWLCHVDRLETAPGQRLLASVLYLFADASLGGTSFYRPIRPREDVLRLLADAATRPRDEVRRVHGLEPGYMGAGNAWFERVLTVPARFNRLIAYDGGLFHSGHIPDPARLSADPRRGRLTWNGFFVCERIAG